MGPTLFCPASQGVSQEDDLRRAYFSFINCSQDSLLSYALPLKMGELTMYDSNVFHSGTGNQASQDRPVLQLSWAADVTSIKTRKYAERTFSGNTSRWELMSLDLDAFRSAASRLKS